MFSPRTLKMDKIGKILDDPSTIEDYLPEDWHKIHRKRQELGGTTENNDLLIPSFEQCLRKNLDNKVKNFKEQIKNKHFTLANAIYNQEYPQYDVNLTPKTELPSFLHRWNTPAKLLLEPSYPANSQKFDRVYHNIIKELESDDRDLYKLHREVCTISGDTPKVFEETCTVPEDLPIPLMIAAKTVRTIINSSKHSESQVDGQSDFSSSRGPVASIVKSDTFKFTNPSIIHELPGRYSSITSNQSKLSCKSEQSKVSDLESIKPTEDEQEQVATSDFESPYSPSCDIALSDSSNNEDTHDGVGATSESDNVHVDITPVNAASSYGEESVKASPIVHSLHEENNSDLGSDLSLSELDVADDTVEECNPTDFANKDLYDKELEENVEDEDINEVDINVNHEDVQEPDVEQNIADLEKEDPTSDVEYIVPTLEPNLGLLQFKPEATDAEPSNAEDTLVLAQESIHFHYEDLRHMENTVATSDYYHELDTKTTADPSPKEDERSADSPRSEEIPEETHSTCESKLEDTLNVVDPEVEDLIPNIHPISQDNASEDHNLTEDSDNPATEEFSPAVSPDADITDEEHLDVIEQSAEVRDVQMELDTTENSEPVYTDSEDNIPKPETQNFLGVSENEAIIANAEENVDKPKLYEVDDSPVACLSGTETLISDNATSEDDSMESEYLEPCGDTPNDDDLTAETWTFGDNTLVEDGKNVEEFAYHVNEDGASEESIIPPDGDSNSDTELGSSVCNDYDLNGYEGFNNEDSSPQIGESDENKNVYEQNSLQQEESEPFDLEGTLFGEKAEDETHL